MLSNSKSNMFRKENTELNVNLQTLLKLLTEKKHDEASSMLAADPDLYQIKGCELTDADGHQFPNITLFTYMLWKRDMESINIFINACSTMSAGDQYNALDRMKSNLITFKKSGTVMIHDGIKHKHHHGVEIPVAQINIDDLITQISARKEVVRKNIASATMNSMLGH